MNKFDLIRRQAIKHLPEILTGLGIGGMVTTTIMAVKATPKAMELIEEANYERLENGTDELTPIETVKVAWRPYVPAMVMGTLSVACLIGASSAHTRRTTALATLYKLSENTLATYRDKVIETVGEEKEREIKRKVAHEKTETEANQTQVTQMYIGDTSDARCIDPMSKQEIVININKIKEAENKLNAELLSSDYVSLNDYYEYIGFEPTSLGGMLGWRSENGTLDIVPYPATDKRGLPCLVLDFNIDPEYDFDKVCR